MYSRIQSEAPRKAVTVDFIFLSFFTGSGGCVHLSCCRQRTSATLSDHIPSLHMGRYLGGVIIPRFLRTTSDRRRERGRAIAAAVRLVGMATTLATRMTGPPYPLSSLHISERRQRSAGRKELPFFFSPICGIPRSHGNEALTPPRVPSVRSMGPRPNVYVIGARQLLLTQGGTAVDGKSSLSLSLSLPRAESS